MTIACDLADGSHSAMNWTSARLVRVAHLEADGTLEAAVVVGRPAPARACCARCRRRAPSAPAMSLLAPDRSDAPAPARRHLLVARLASAPSPNRAANTELEVNKIRVTFCLHSAVVGPPSTWARGGAPVIARSRLGRHLAQRRNARAAPCMCLVAAMDVALAASGARVAAAGRRGSTTLARLKRASRDPTAKYLSWARCPASCGLACAPSSSAAGCGTRARSRS